MKTVGAGSSLKGVIVSPTLPTIRFRRSGKSCAACPRALILNGKIMKLFIAVAAIAATLLYSCQKEELITPQPTSTQSTSLQGNTEKDHDSQQMIRVKKKVKDQAGVDISSGDVSITHQDTSLTYGTTVANGIFEFTEVLEGNLLLNIYSDGYLVYEDRMFLDKDDTTGVCTLIAE
jgi:FlaG/FlaF family flagellin (archaellin)